MNAPVTIDRIEIGAAVWAWARGNYRHARVVAKARSRVTIAFRLARAGRLVRQDVALAVLRLERPNHQRVVDVTAPTAAA